jgi:DHA3 family macrolide efflux protein-like MFS transporter
MAETPSPTSTRGLFAQPGFRTLWLAQFVSVFGDFLAVFGVISLITFRLHGLASDVALVIVAYMAPVSLIAPLAGVLVDRWPVRRVMIASDLIRACIAASLVLATTVPQIALAMAALGIVSSFFGPAQSIVLRTLVAREDLLSANALFAQAFYAVRVLSPALAGTLVAWLGEGACFWIDTASFVFSAASIARLVIVRTAPAPHESARSMWRDFVAGNRFIFTHKELSFAFLSSCAAMFVLSSFSPLISVYIRDQLHKGPMVYGGISAMVGVGLIAGTQLVRTAAKRPIEEMVLGGLLGLGLGAGLLGAFTYSATAAASTFLLGCAIAFVMVPAQTLSQKETPHEMQGRVSSTFIALFSLAQVLGMLLSGVLADWLGIRQLFLACGALVVVLACAGWLFLRPRKVAATT